MRTYQDHEYNNRILHIKSSGLTFTKIVINVAGCLPLVITDSESLNAMALPETTKGEALGFSYNNNRLVDFLDEPVNVTANNKSFNYMKTIKSLVTGNRLDFYYDLKYQQILLLPNTTYLKASPVVPNINIKSYRLGSSRALGNPNILSTTSSEELIKLEQPNFSKLKSSIILIPGSINTSNVNKSFLQRDVTGGNIALGELGLISFIELGTYNEVFGNTPQLPVYLFYQRSLLDYGLEYISVLKKNELSNKKIYIILNF